MMTTLWPLVVCCLPLQSGSGAVADETSVQAAPDAPRSHTASSGGSGETYPEGLWPSTKLMGLLAGRWAEDVTAKYELSDAQLADLRRRVTDRWPRFFTAHRREIQPLINEFLEMRLEPEPPSKARVQAWGQAALGAFGAFRAELIASADDFRAVLSPLQRARFEGDMLEFGVGMKFAEQKLRRWADGEFKPREFWDPPATERRRRRAERAARNRRASGEAEADEPEPADQIVAELDAWDAYVKQFARLYELDEGQLGAARSCLRELKARAIDHRNLKRVEIARLEARIARGDAADAELADIKQQLVALYGPIDKMFEELQTRLNAIPTVEQRARVAAATQDKAADKSRD